MKFYICRDRHPYNATNLVFEFLQDNPNKQKFKITILK